MEDSSLEIPLAPISPGPSQPPAYLPRIAYKPPEPDPSDAPPGSQAGDGRSRSAPPEQGKKKPKAPKPSPEGGPEEADGHKKVLKEETPEFDTFEARKRARLVVGAVVAAIILVSGFVIFKTLAPSPEPDWDDIPEEAPRSAGPSPAELAKTQEAQAKALLEESRRYAKKGSPEQALQRVERLLAAYPKSGSAEEAKAARDRHAQGLPLFPDGPVVIATKPAEPDPPAAEQHPQIVAEPPDANVSEKPAVVEVSPPPTPPEPRRETGLTFETADVPPRELPAGFRARPEAGVHPSGWPLEITCDRDGSGMVLVAGGPFLQGNDRGGAAERPEHQATLATFYVDQHEVTNYQYHGIFKPNAGPAAATPPSSAASGGETPPDDSRPVVQVNLDEARAYAAWAGKALPTEAQWEKAARGTDGRLFPWGQGDPRWSSPRQPRQIDPVASFATDLSPYGAFDMAGNVWEWTADFFDTRYYQQFRDTPAVDPTGPSQARGKFESVTVKGGSNAWDVAWRSGMRSGAKLPYLGFRCVLQVEPSAPPLPAKPQAAPGNPPAKDARDPASPVPF